MVNKGARTAALDSWDLFLRARAKRTEYTYSTDSHRDRYGELPRMYFLHRTSPLTNRELATPARRVFCFWTGDNELSPGRVKGLTAMRKKIMADVILVTPDNLSDWIVEDFPLHRAYNHLSYVHRSDYLRAYFAAHHGGGYSDIKSPLHTWESAWDNFANPATWLVGYREKSSRSCGGDDHTKLGRDIHRNYSRLVGFGAFITRPGTPFAHEWLQEVERRLDYYEEELCGSYGGTWGEGDGYPIRWIEIGSDVFHPLQLKYLSHVRHDNSVHPTLRGHR